MTRFDWPALIVLGLQHLRLTPDQFWALTPIELVTMAGIDPGAERALSRGWLENLAAQYPDKNTEGQTA